MEKLSINICLKLIVYLLVKLFFSSIISVVLIELWRTTARLAKDINVLLKKLIVFSTWLLMASVSIRRMIVLMMYTSRKVKFAKAPDATLFISLSITLSTKEGVDWRLEGWTVSWGTRPPDSGTLNIWLGNTMTVEFKIVMFMCASLSASKLLVNKLRFLMSWNITTRGPDLRLPWGTVNFWQFLILTNLLLSNKLPVVFTWNPENCIFLPALDKENSIPLP